jgi:pimeloyl-ACP methyl ester carboxylesterase
MTTNTASTTAASEATPELPTQYFTRPEGTLAYTDYGGSGQLALMLPGMGALRSEYRFLAPVLRDAGYRAVTVDLRGQGDSSVPWQTYDVPSVGDDILALIEHLNAGPAHVIATSYSPAPAVWAAVERPNLIRSLVLIAGFFRDTKLNPVMSAAYWLMMNNPWRVQAWRMFYRTLYPTRKPADFEDYLDQLTANLSQPGRFDAVKGFPSAPRQPWKERLPRLHTPTLIVMGTKDPDFPDPVAEGEYGAAETRGKLVLIEEAGHYPQTEMPEKTAPEILDFLAQV